MAVREWTRRDIADGAVTYLTEAPQVHIHYLTSDVEADAQGFGRAELCCHGCGTALVITYGWPQAEDALRPLRDEFQARHQGCPNLGGEMLCPLDRTITTHLDLR